MLAEPEPHSLLNGVLPFPQSGDMTSRELLEGHLRSLTANHLRTWCRRTSIRSNPGSAAEWISLHRLKIWALGALKVRAHRAYKSLKRLIKPAEIGRSWVWRRLAETRWFCLKSLRGPTSNQRNFSQPRRISPVLFLC